MWDEGWLIDASISHEKQGLLLWIKPDKHTRGYLYRKFEPSVYVDTPFLNSQDWSAEKILEMMQDNEAVTRTRIVNRFLSVYDDETSLVLQVFTRPDLFYKMIQNLEILPNATIFHADMDPIHQFFMTKEIFPFGRVRFKHSEGIIEDIICLDDREAAQYDIPELEEIRLEVFIDTNQIFPQANNPIHHIEITHQGRIIKVEGHDEVAILRRLQERIDSIDPDVIITRGGDDDVFRYLSIRSRINGITLAFSRDGSPLRVIDRNPTSFWQYNQIVFRSGNQVMFNGRIHIDRAESLYYSPSGVEGIIEGCRVALSQPQKVARMSIGTVNAAVQYYNAIKRKILIPPVKRNPEFLKTINDLAAIDRGGLIFQPRPDIYEDVAECDFSSMYPTLMVTRNISPETICTGTQCDYNHQFCVEVPEVTFRICNRKRGIVAQSLELILRKRSMFKELIRNGVNADKYERMQNTLKGILVACFGYLGFKNARFGRVEAHTAVTAFAREVLLKTQEIGEELGFEVIHGIVDSLWVKSKDAIEYDRVQEFCERVTKTVDIDMSLKGVYKWMVIPSSRHHSVIAPLNRYYGIYANGTIKTRGIETRRRDTCLYVGDCQEAMIKSLARGRNKREFLQMIPHAWDICEGFIERLWQGDVDIRDLILNARLTRNPDEYRATSRASLVAKQLVKAGKKLYAGQKVRYLMVEADSLVPMRRVKALELLDNTTQYDVKAYAKLCVRAFENLIPDQYLEQDQLAACQLALAMAK